MEKRTIASILWILLIAVWSIPPLAAQTVTDADHDGIPDDWERLGFVDIQWPDGKQERLDLTKDGPVSADHKDIFVLVAWMQDAKHTHKPDNKALQVVKDAFLAAPVSNPDGLNGIRLHVYFAPTAVVEKAQIGKMLPNGEYDWTEFNQIKQKVFPAKLRGAFHFCLFAHDIDPAHYTGIAKTIPGKDYIVSLGAFGPNQVGDTNSQAGTFMHELGHDLGLHHGGGDDSNNKPNYISVMNYLFQLDGLLLDGVPGNYDYSRFAADLNEKHLNENLGLNIGPDLARFGTQFYCASEPDHTQPPTSIAQAIDWNCNKTFEDDIAADINADGIVSEAPLRGFNDWPAIVLSTAAGSAGAPLTVPVRIQQELDLKKANTITLPPTAHLQATPITGGVKLSWKKVPLDRVLAYQIYRSTSDNSYSMIGSSQSGDFIDKTVSPGSYSYTVKTVYAPHGIVVPKPFATSDLGGLLTHTEALSEVMSTATDSTTKMATLGRRRGSAQIPKWPALLETAPSAPARVEIK